MFFVALASVLVWTGGHAATPFQGDHVLGKEKADAERCLECHVERKPGLNPVTGQESMFSALNGQFPEYMLKQMQDFKSGARKSDQMALVSRIVPDEDLGDILAYFASLPRVKAPGQGQGDGRHDAAQRLFQQGDPSRGVIACASCHGEAGRGLSAAQGPVLGGQDQKYLTQQLLDWRSGFRRNSGDAVMANSVKSLNDAEIQALAAYLAVQ